MTVTNILFAGLGGQGVLLASDIAADAAFRAGFDVKKSEIHGMSQRGGSVTSDLRFGDRVDSPMIPAGEADFLVVLAPDQIAVNRWQLRAGGTIIKPSMINAQLLESKKSINIALLGILSMKTGIPQQSWLDAIRANLPEKLHQANFTAFELGRQSARIESQKQN
jgi:indolepyruvate ferredoxin oxidoreductase beta subunit